MRYPDTTAPVAVSLLSLVLDHDPHLHMPPWVLDHPSSPLLQASGTCINSRLQLPTRLVCLRLHTSTSDCLAPHHHMHPLHQPPRFVTTLSPFSRRLTPVSSPPMESSMVGLQFLHRSCSPSLQLLTLLMRLMYCAAAVAPTPLIADTNQTHGGKGGGISRSGASSFSHAS